MEIFVRVEDDGECKWLCHDEEWGEWYLDDYAIDNSYEAVATPFKSYVEAKRAASIARDIVYSSGSIGKIRTTYWELRGADLVQVKFDRAGNRKN